MNRFVGRNRFVDSLYINGIGKEISVFDGFINTGKVLIHHASSAQRHMANFTVAHLSFGQPYGHT